MYQESVDSEWKDSHRQCCKIPCLILSILYRCASKRIIIMDYSSIGRTSDGKARRSTDAGSSPRCGYGFSARINFQCRLSHGVRTAG